MFVGDDDLSFVDDTFLQSVLNPDAAPNVPQRENKNVKDGNIFKSSNFPINASPSKNQRGESTRMCNSENESPTKKVSEHNKNNKIPVNIPNEFDDDDFPYESLDSLENVDFHPPPLSTPPDSEINHCSGSTFCNDRLNVGKGDVTGVNKKINPLFERNVEKGNGSSGSSKTNSFIGDCIGGANRNTDNTTTKQSDFRSRLLQALSKRKNEGSKISKLSHNPNSELLGTGDGYRDNISTGGSYNENISNQRPNSHARPDQYRLPGNEESVFRQEDEGDIFRQENERVMFGQKGFRQENGRLIFGREEFPRPSGSPAQRRVTTKRRTVSPGGPVVQKRRFPGPAGLLPQPGSGCVLPQPDNDSSSSSLAGKIDETIMCSQTSANSFTKGPWQQMIKDLEFDPDDPNSPIRVFTIKWVLRRAGLRGQAGVRKVPFLAVLISSISETRTDPTVLFKDLTGEIKGSVARSVMHEFHGAIQIGSVLVLRGVPVLSPIGLRSVATSGEFTRRHYLNITPNSVLSIYTPDSSGHIITTAVSNINLQELNRQALSPTVAVGPKVIVEEEEEEEPKENPSYSNNLHYPTNTSPSHNFSFNQPARWGQNTPVNVQGNDQSTPFNVQRSGPSTLHNVVQRSGQSTPFNQSPKHPQGGYSNVQRSGIGHPLANVQNTMRSGTFSSPGNVNKVQRNFGSTPPPLSNVSNMQRNSSMHSPGISNVQRNNNISSPSNANNVKRSDGIQSPGSVNSVQLSSQYKFISGAKIRSQQQAFTPRPTLSHGLSTSNRAGHPSLPPPIPVAKTLNRPQHTSIPPPISVAKPALPNRQIQEPVSASQIFSSQEEEEDVNELLSGLDADSFFDEDF